MSMSYSSLAVIGFGCNLPGGSNGAESYWDTIIQGRSGIKSSRSAMELQWVSRCRPHCTRAHVLWTWGAARRLYCTSR